MIVKARETRRVTAKRWPSGPCAHALLGAATRGGRSLSHTSCSRRLRPGDPAHSQAEAEGMLHGGSRGADHAGPTCGSAFTLRPRVSRPRGGEPASQTRTWNACTLCWARCGASITSYGIGARLHLHSHPNLRMTGPSSTGSAQPAARKQSSSSWAPRHCTQSQVRSPEHRAGSAMQL